ASAGAVAALLLGGVTGFWLSVSAFAGGAAVGLLLYAVAWRGGVTGYRFVLSGIGVAYVCTSIVGYLLTRSDVQEAQAALLWMTGSVAQADWPLVTTLAVAVAVLVPLVLLVARGLDLLLLGDEQAAGLGLRPELTRAAVIALGVALACVATAAAGPVAFVALIAAPVARRLLGDGSLALVQSALVGVVLVVGADLVAQHVLPALLPIQFSVPVGVVTGAVGGPYLIWLMVAGRTRTS
ncbi:MAG: iron chelate uptake ABC transporter family permease subunit, partial [Nocardioides sp.]|nr:iron chelate uptake ABC transporter family permease subunit [Nocardioides sp.]